MLVREHLGAFGAAEDQEEAGTRLEELEDLVLTLSSQLGEQLQVVLAPGDVLTQCRRGVLWRSHQRARCPQREREGCHRRMEAAARCCAVCCVC